MGQWPSLELTRPVSAWVRSPPPPPYPGEQKTIDNDETTGIMRTALYSFAEASADNSGAGSKDYVHIRIQQRNGRKSLTTVQGLKKEFSYNKILKDLKK
ncbi:hypothetical protein RND71_024249 [Anisodus tanguticus]|uniref:SUI1 domain-containing protein n=1 Tax=Anisodus tanguticus TaxID=243964 RepID=A0AAE1RQT9_9SOLA|nr:hypothetical protein RND71_024249 [Anisodus tanguticus]